MNRLLFAALLSLGACSAPENNQPQPTDAAIADVGDDDMGPDDADTNDRDAEVQPDLSADIGTDLSIGCSTDNSCPAPTDDSYSLSCVDDVCVSTCNAGFQDHDGDTICQAECADECGLRGCDDASGTATCICPAGFSFDGTADCILNDIVDDPEFTDPAAWTISGWQTDFAGTDANGNLGQLSFTGQEACRTDIIATQEVFVPAIEDVGPLKVEISAEMTCPGPAWCRVGSAPVVTLGDFTSYPARATRVSGDASYDFCVPPTAYGTTTTLYVRSQEDFCGFNGAADTTLARVNVVPAEPGRCDNLNQIVNGDFEAADDGSAPGWVLEQAASPASTSVELVDGSNALEIGRTRCEEASATTRFTANHAAGTALKFRYTTSAQRGLEVSFPRLATLSHLAPTHSIVLPEAPSWTTESLCLPAGLRDAEVNLSFAPYLTAGGLCNEPAFAAIDDVELVEDANCAASPLSSGDFDSRQFEWAYRFENLLAFDDVEGVTEFRTTNNNTFIYLEATGVCSQPRVTAVEFIPPGVNAVAFDYQYRPYPETTPVVEVRVGSSIVDYLVPSAGWVAGRVCLAPNSTGLAQRFSAMAGHAGICSPEDVIPGYMQLDNLAFVDDPACN